MVENINGAHNYRRSHNWRQYGILVHMYSHVLHTKVKICSPTNFRVYCISLELPLFASAKVKGRIHCQIPDSISTHGLISLLPHLAGRAAMFMFIFRTAVMAAAVFLHIWCLLASTVTHDGTGVGASVGAWHSGIHAVAVPVRHGYVSRCTLHRNT